MARTLIAVVLTVLAVVSLGACSGSSAVLVDRAGPRWQTGVRNSLCGDALARVMQREFINPASSPATRLRARRTLDLIARHRTSIVPVCGRRPHG